MQRSDYLKLSNQLTLLEKELSTLRLKGHVDFEKYKEKLDKYIKLSEDIIRGKEEEDSSVFLLDDDDEEF